MHTATDVTTGARDVGPDYETGYGLVNVAEGATFLTDALSGAPETQENFLFELDLGNGEETVFDFQVIADEVKATLVWTDLPGTPVSGANNRTPMLVNDLDLWAESESNTFYPWTLDVLNPAAAATRDKRNSVDNVEQVFIDDLAPPVSPEFPHRAYRFSDHRHAGLLPAHLGRATGAGAVQFPTLGDWIESDRRPTRL